MGTKKRASLAGGPESELTPGLGCGGRLGFRLCFGSDLLSLDLLEAALALFRFVVLLAHKGSLLCQSVTFVC